MGLGVDHINAADTYGFGVVEDILREALHTYPDRQLVAAKVGQVQPRPGAWAQLGRPAFPRHQYEITLRRLGVDRIRLLYLRRVDPDVPFADQIGTMEELWDEGKIAHVGRSEVAAEHAATVACATAADSGTTAPTPHPPWSGRSRNR
ncbi:aldo/keto reductase [Streptomyces sp. NPDC054804]